MGLPKLEYEKVWTSAEDFPTYEGNEEQVRLDYQYHPDAIKDFFNNVLLPAIEGSGAGEGASCVGIFPVAGLPGASTVQEALEVFVDMVRSVTQGSVPDASIGTNKLIDASVTTAKIQDFSVTDEKIADNAVTSSKVSDRAVTEDKLAEDSVTGEKIKDGAVSSNKIASGAVESSKLSAGAVTTMKIADGAVESSKLAIGAVTSAAIASEAVTAEKIASGAVSGAALQSGCVSAENLATDAVRLIFRNYTVGAARFEPDTTYGDYPFRASVPLPGVTAGMTPDVMFSLDAVNAGEYAPVAESYDGGIYIYAVKKPNAPVAIPVITLWR